MTDTPETALLSPYRVLDLTDERGLLCSKILGDLGADVVQVEPPGGSPARQVGPFYGDDPSPGKSLFWWAYSSNKRGITLDLEHADGRALLERLAATADFVIESFDPGYLESVGLGYSRLSGINPRLVMVSITAFGQDGPYAGYKASDITGMAMGGFMHLTGDPDRPPLRPSFAHFYLHGSAAGAAAAMLAHTHRALTGEGQHVDVSCQQAVARTLAHAPQIWDIEGAILQRMGVYRQTSGDNRVRINWPCVDGYVNYMLQGGGVAPSTRALFQWMEDDGFDVTALQAFEWETMGYGRITPEVMDTVVGPMAAFFRTPHSRGADQRQRGTPHPAVPRGHPFRPPPSPPTGGPRVFHSDGVPRVGSYGRPPRGIHQERRWHILGPPATPRSIGGRAQLGNTRR